MPKPIKAFPSTVRAAGLAPWLESKTVKELQKIEEEMRAEIPFGPVLRARTDRGLERGLMRAMDVAISYYIQSGVILWRALKHDYSRLREISRASCRSIEEAFFQHANRLDRETFVNIVAAVRVWSKVSEWVITAEEKKEINERTPPLDFLNYVVEATFLTACLLEYVTGKIRGARQYNLKLLADLLCQRAETKYEQAVESKWYAIAGETQHWFWSPAWQEGEVEADLDRHLGNVKRFDSAEDLIYSLRTSS
ncbi:MAG: hypothetical protein HYY00_06125 [Chloroflexi bacterium]|nr:hypothetical protein [Chloroflexota bacterium]